MKATTNVTLARIFSIALLAGALSINGALATTTVFNLVDGNSTADINVGSTAGMFNWTVDGQDQLVQQWFAYRVGSTGDEIPINYLPLISAVQTGGNQLSSLYGTTAFTIRLDYVLNGQGSGMASINESITINNLGQSPLDMHFFQYSDFDILGSGGNDVGALGKSGGLFNYATQGDGSLLSPFFTETVLTPGANHGEIAFSPSILLRLGNGVPDTLSDFAGPLGPGDITWAFQWDLTIAPGSSELISKVKYLTVPEPSSFALVSLGLLALLARRRRA